MVVLVVGHVVVVVVELILETKERGHRAYRHVNMQKVERGESEAATGRRRSGVYGQVAAVREELGQDHRSESGVSCSGRIHRGGGR